MTIFWRFAIHLSEKWFATMGELEDIRGMAPTTTLSSLSAAEIRIEVQEMREFRKNLLASPKEAKRFLDAVHKASGVKKRGQQ